MTTKYTNAARSEPLSPGQRRLIGRKGGLTTAARGHVNTGPAREARKRSFLDQVDPERLLNAADREKRARAAEAAYMADLQFKATKAKARAKAARQAGSRADDGGQEDPMGPMGPGRSLNRSDDSDSSAQMCPKVVASMVHPLLPVTSNDLPDLANSPRADET